MDKSNVLTYITLGLRGGEPHVIGSDPDKEKLLRRTPNLAESHPLGPYQVLGIFPVFKGGGAGDLETLCYTPPQRAALELTGDSGMHLS